MDITVYKVTLLWLSHTYIKK